MTRTLRPPPPTPVDDHVSTATLVTRLVEQSSQLLRDELMVARFELVAKAKGLGVGAGLLAGAAVLGLAGAAGALVTGGLAIALALPGWLAALIITAALLTVAGLLARVGLASLKRGLPPVPTQAVSGVQQDLQTVREARHR